MSAKREKLGFIGIGLMGTPMVRRLLEAGYEVAVWNRSQDKLKPVLEAGATACSGAAEVADRADILCMCLTDSAAVEAVVFGPGGVAESARAPRILVDFSSILPDKSRDYADRLRAACATAWVDCPVSGGVPGAEQGTLSLMAGGAAEDVEAVRPVLAHLSSRLTHMGPAGAGQTTKLCNQIISGCTMTIIAESMNFAARAGVDPTRLVEALTGGFADSRPFQIFGPRMAARNFENPMGHMVTMLKDLDSVREVARGAEAITPMTSTAAELLRQGVNRGFGDQDISRLVQIYAGETD